MKWKMHYMRLISLFIVLLPGSIAMAQSVSVTLNIAPPYSPKIAEYVETPGKILLVLRNNTARQLPVYLQASITGDNGISAATNPSVKPAQPLLLQPGQLLNADMSLLQDLFAAAKLNYSGTTAAAVLKKNGLPEGTYEICVRVFDYNTNLPLSGDAPIGCRTIHIANLEPPFLLKPVDVEAVNSLLPQNIIFTWTNAAGAGPGIQYKLRVVEIIDPNKNPNDAFNSATTPTFFDVTVGANVFVYGPAQPPLVPGRRYAWAVTAMPGPGGMAIKNNGRSEVHSFTFGQAAPAITLSYPQNDAVFEAEKSKFYFKWDYSNPGNVGFYEDVIMVEVNPGQPVEEAVKNNKRVNSTNEPSKKAMFNYAGSSAEGKTFAWYVTLNDNGKIYKSNVRTFKIKAGAMAGNTPAAFDLCGFPVTVNSNNPLKNNGGNKFSGTAYTHLYKGGPEVVLYLDNVVIQPFASELGKENGKKSKDNIGVDKLKDPGQENNYIYSDWRAVSLGTLKNSNLKGVKIKFSEARNYGGSVWFDAESMKFIPSLKSHFDEAHHCYVQDAVNSYQTVELTGTFNWQTEFLYKGADDEQLALYKAHETVKWNYNTLFDENDSWFLSIKDGDDYNILHLMSKTVLKLIPSLQITHNGTTAVMSFDGYCNMPSPDAQKPGLSVNFQKITNFSGIVHNITPYTVSLNNDNSVTASFDKVNLNLSNGFCSVTIPDLAIKLKYNSTTYDFNYKKAFFNPTSGLFCKEETASGTDITISSFPLSSQSSTVSIVKTKLAQLQVKGEIKVPFINRTGNVEFAANGDGVQEGFVDFPLAGKSNLFTDNKTGNICEFQPYSGKLVSNRLIVNGKLNFLNYNGKEKGLNMLNLDCPDFYIRGNGEVGMESESWSGAPVTDQKAGTYNGFKYTPVSLQLISSGGKYKINLHGIVTLADNLSSDNKGYPNLHTSFGFPPKGDASAGQKDVTVSNSDVTAGALDAVCDFKGNFKLFDNDPVYGKGFVCEGKFGIKQPSDMEVHAKMIVARAPEHYNYWFIEAGEENLFELPIGVLDLGIYGFTGRVYYKMKHAGTNINTDDYVPDNGSSVGVYALTQLKTLTDNGIKFWGKVALEVLTTKSGLQSISFRGDGDLMSSGVGSQGMIRAHDCTLDFSWAPKEVKGNFNVDVNFMNAITASASAGFDITDHSYSFWGDASTGELFGNTSFGMKNFGFSLSDQNARLYGDFSLITISKDFNFYICDPSVAIYSGVSFDATVNYSPFQFKGSGNLYGKVHVAGCRLHGDLGLNLNAQLMFPNPTCVSAGISIETPLKDFDFSAGISNGSIFFGNCYE